MNEAWLSALIGGALIGVSVSLMLWGNGRVTGISGIAYGIIDSKQDRGWRVSFLLGLLSGGAVLGFLRPEMFAGQLLTADWTVIVAGILVGFGTVLGSGCTSGHGVCGISRLSPRSLIATMIFIIAGVASVALFRAIGVLP